MPTPNDDVSVSVGAELQSLLDSLSGAEQAAGRTGQAISDAFNRPIGDALEQHLEATFNTTVKTGEQFTLFGGQIEQASTQMTLFDTNAIAAADSMQQIGDSAGVAAGKVEELTPAAHGAAEAAHEAEGAMSDWAEKLTQFAEALVITEGLKEFATEALHVFGTVEKVTVSMTALTGSASATREVIEKVKELAATQPFSFPELAPTAQKLAAFGVEAEQIPKILQSMGDSAAATGSAFDGVASRFDRIAFSGNASSRSLVGLGLTVTDLAKAMQVADGEVKNAFKDLDQQERINVLIEALSKFQGQSALIAQTVPGHWQIVKNKFEEVMEGMGAALAPFAQKVMSVLGDDVLPAIQQAVTGFNSLPGPVRDTATVLGILVGAVVPVTLALAALGVALPAAAAGLAMLAPVGAAIAGVFPGVAGTLIAVGQAVTVAAAAWGGWKLGEWLHENSPLLRDFGDAMGDLITKIPGVTQLIVYMTGAQAGMTAANKSLADSVQILQDKLKEHGITVDRGKMSLDEYAAALRKAAQAAPALADAEDGLSKAAQRVVDAQQKANEKVAEAQKVVDELRQGLADGTVSQAAYTRAVSDLDKAQAAANITLKAAEPILTSQQQLLADVTVAANKQVQSFKDAESVYLTLKDKADQSVAGQLALADALKKLEAAAKSMAIEVDSTGDKLKFGLEFPARDANTPVAALVATLNGLGPEVEKDGIIINGKFVPALKDATIATGELVNGVNVLKGSANAASQAVDTLGNSAKILADNATQMSNAIADATKTMVDQAAQAYATATAVNTLAEADRAAADASNALGSSGGGKKGGGGGGGPNQDAMEFWATAVGAAFDPALMIDVVGVGAFQDQFQQYAYQLANGTFSGDLAHPNVSGGGKPTMGDAARSTTTAAAPVQALASAASSAATAVSSLATASTSSANASTALAEANAALGTNFTNVNEALGAVEQAIMQANQAGQLHDALDQIQAKLWAVSSPLQATALSLGTASTALGSFSAATGSVVSSLTGASTAIVNAGQAISQSTTIAGAAAVATLQAVSAVPALLQAFTGAMAAPKTFSTAAPLTLPAFSGGAANALTLGSGPQGMQLIFNVTGNNVVGAGGMQQLTQMLSDQTIMRLKQAGLKI